MAGARMLGCNLAVQLQELATTPWARCDLLDVRMDSTGKVGSIDDAPQVVATAACGLQSLKNYAWLNVCVSCMQKHDTYARHSC
jgi:hypothetical protein